MTENMSDHEETRFTIQVIGIQQGASQEKLIAGLQKLYKNKGPEEIRKALNRLPLVLSRSATKSQALKVKKFLESVGAFIELTDTSPAKGREVVDEERAEVSDDAPPSEETKPPEGEERRTKPRVHEGIKLNPMGIGELLDRSFRMMREYFWLFFLIILIPQGIYFLLGKGVQIFFRGFGGSGVSMSMGVGFGISTFLSLVILIILQFWAQGALIHAVSETYLGHDTSVRGSYGAMRRLLGRLLGTLFLWTIGVMWIPALAGIILAILIPTLMGMGAGGWTVVFLVLIVGLLAAWLFFRLFLNWLLVDKVVVLERIGWIKALKRSTELMKGRTEPGFWKSNRMKAALILLLGFLIAAVIQLIFQGPAVIFSVILKGNLLILTVLEILNIVGNTLATTFTATAMILYYYDIRLRKEGFDLKMMAENL